MMKKKKFKTLRQWQYDRRRRWLPDFRGGGRKRAFRLYRAQPLDDDYFMEM